MKTVRVAAAVAARGLAAADLCACVAALGGAFSERLDVLAHFAPVYLGIAVIALALCGVSGPGRRRVTLSLAGLALAAAIGLMSPELLLKGAPEAPALLSEGRLKIVQFNVLGGENLHQQHATEWVLAQNADVIFLQEPGDVLKPLIAAGYHAACRGCGAVVLTRAKPEWLYMVPGGGGRASPLAAIGLRDALGRYVVVSVHRPWPNDIEENRRQRQDLARLLSHYDRRRVIVAGDFNSTPWSFVRRREDADLGLVRLTRLLPTWPAARVSHNRLPAPFPYLPIDHLYAGKGWSAVEVRRGPRLGSDHFPILATLAPVADGAADGSTVHPGQLDPKPPQPPPNAVHERKPLGG